VIVDVPRLDKLPECPTCLYGIAHSPAKCPFCGRTFHDFCLESRGCQADGCARANYDPPDRFDEWRQLWAALLGGLVALVVWSRVLGLPAGDSPRTTRTLLLSLGCATLIAVVLHVRKRRGLKPWGHRLNSVVTRGTAFAPVLAGVLVVRPLPLPAYDLAAAAVLAGGVLAVVGLTSRFSRTGALFGLALTVQAYALLTLVAQPDLTRLDLSAQDLYRRLRDGSLPPMRYAITGSTSVNGRQLVVTNGGSFPIDGAIPGIGVVKEIRPDGVRIQGEDGRVSLVPYQSGGGSSSTPPAPSADPVPKQLQQLQHDMREYQRVQTAIEKQVLGH